MQGNKIKLRVYSLPKLKINMSWKLAAVCLVIPKILILMKLKAPKLHLLTIKEAKVRREKMRIAKMKFMLKMRSQNRIIIKEEYSLDNSKTKSNCLLFLPQNPLL